MAIVYSERIMFNIAAPMASHLLVHFKSVQHVRGSQFRDDGPSDPLCDPAGLIGRGGLDMVKTRNIMSDRF